MVGKRLVNTGGAGGAAAFDPLQNFETVTYTGNGSTQKITGYIRKGAAFNGSSSIMYVNGFDTTTNFSISLWFKTSASSNQVLANNGGGEGTNTGFLWYLDSSGKILLVTNSGGGGFTGTQSSLSYNDGNWHNAVLNYASNGVYSIYVDNQSVVSETSSRYTGGDVAGRPFAIGAWSQLNQFWFNGSIDQVRIFDRVLLEDNNGVDEIQALADETYADPKKSTTDYFGDGSGVALYELDEDANGTAPSETLVETNQLINLRAENYTSGSTWTDISGQNNNATLTNPTKPTTESVHFDYADLGAQNQYGGNNVSIEFFIKTTNTDDDYFLTAYNAGGLIAGEFLLYIPLSSANGKPYLTVSGSTSSKSNLSFDHTVVQNDWTHYALVYDSSLTGNTNRFTMYVNGSAVTTSVEGGVDDFDNSNFMGDTSTLFIGKRGGGTDYEEMDIKEFRIYSKSLSSQEVAQNYAASAFKYNGTPTNVNFLGMAFQPDLVWVKGRSISNDHSLFDSIRTATKRIKSNSTAAEDTLAGGVTSFDSNGFTIGSNYSQTSTTYVAWCWKAGGSVTPNNNTNGTIPSTVSANQDAGFSIVKYTTPSGGSGTVGHGLSTTPEIYITKRTDSTSDWYFNTTAIDGSLDYLVLNTTATKTDSSGITAPTPTVFSASNFGTQDEEWISYCFHSVDFFQKVGSYLGTGLAGNIVYTDSNGDGTGTGAFRPRFVMWKAAIRPSGGGSWYIFDSTRTTSNPQGQCLQANEPAQEFDGTSVFSMDFNSNGFTINATNNEINQSGSTYIYLAIA